MRLMGFTALWVFLLDQATKLYALFVVFGLQWAQVRVPVDDLPRPASVEVFPPFLVFRMAWNKGVNFGLFANFNMRWVLVGVALLLLETTVSVTSQGLSVVKRLGRIPLRRDHWDKDQILGASLQEHRDVTTYTSWSQRNTVRAHSFILTLRVDLGQNRVEDLEVYEFATRADGKQVVDALKSLHIPVA